MAKEQTALSFGKGITNVPGDATCDDNALEECVGMVYEDGEHRVVQKPVPKDIGTVNGRLLFVHKIPDGVTVNYISGNQDGIYFNGDHTICQGGNDIQVTAIGKTLIINVDGTTKYAVWKSNTYLFLNDRIPEVEMQFFMSEAKSNIYYNIIQDHNAVDVIRDEEHGVVYTTKVVNISSGQDSTIDSHQLPYLNNPISPIQYWWHEVKKQDQLNEAMIGIVSAHLNDIKKAKKFCFPFFVRYAVRLYDGTHTCISNPILMFPSIHYNRNAYFSKDDMTHLPANHDSDIWSATYDPYYSVLMYKITKALPEGWEDIVKGLDIFVSEEIRTFDLEGNWTIVNPWSSDGEAGQEVVKRKKNKILYDGMTSASYVKKELEVAQGTQPEPQNYAFTSYIMPKQWTDAEFKSRLEDASVFYKILEVDDVSHTSADWVDTSKAMDSSTLLNLTTQDQLENDDYFSHVNMTANIIKAYNSRLHLADISRGFFDGFAHFSNAVRPLGMEPHSYTIVVYINTDSGERIVEVGVANTYEDFAVWLYYPDTRAYKVEVYDMTAHMMFTLRLKEHKGLNGAYVFNQRPFPVDSESSDIVQWNSYTSIPDQAKERERITNRLFVSEVNNPWVFAAKGDVTVGNARIKGIATQTMALGQEEHGIHPLTVFTEAGIYAISQNNEGVYLTSDIFSREVCNNPQSITETDGAVFFSSEKGLMVVVGRDVRCVSEQLSGKNNGYNIEEMSFAEYLTGAFVAYDYRDSLLWIFNPGSRFEEYCWLYSVKSGTFAKYCFEHAVVNAVNDYPDYLLQSGDKVYSLLNRPDINHDGETVGDSFVANTYDATIVTRPMKFENALALKSIRQIRNVHYMEGRLRYRLFASNDLKRWIELKSLRGMAWKYFKMRFDFTGLKATDRFAGTVVVTDERNTNKLR